MEEKKKLVYEGIKVLQMIVDINPEYIIELMSEKRVQH